MRWSLADLTELGVRGMCESRGSPTALFFTFAFMIFPNLMGLVELDEGDRGGVGSEFLQIGGV